MPGKPVITFDENLKHYIIKTLGFDVSTRDGMIVDNDTRQRVLGFDGKPVHIDEFAGFIKTKHGVQAVRSSIVDLLVVSDEVRA